MDFREFYGKYIDLSNSRASGEEIRTLCPAHKDENPSFSFNINTGMYHCFSPVCKLAGGGSLAKFLSIVEDISIKDAEDIVAKEFPKEKVKERKPRASTKAFPISQEDIDNRINALMNHPERVQLLMDITSWTVNTMKKFEIGFDAHEQRYWIPIREHGTLVNIRKYGPGQSNKVIQISGFSEPKIFPYDNLQEREILIMEGEKDCILANQHGFPAVTFTAGAGTFLSEWKTHFKGRDIVICYDIDAAGRAGANKVAQNLLGVSRSVKNVLLPITEPPNGDYTDYVMQGATPQDFRALITATPLVKPVSSGPIDIPDTVYEMDLSRVAEEKMFYKRTCSNVRIISKDSSPSIIPKALSVSCNRDNGKMCYMCDLADKELHEDSIVVTEETPELLQLIECTTRERKKIIRDIFKIPQCIRFIIKETDHQSISRCSVIPSIDKLVFDTSTYNQKYVERDVFVLGAQIEANMDYRMESIAMPDPKSQVLVHLVYAVKPADSSIEEFRMTPDLKKELEIFQCPCLLEIK